MTGEGHAELMFNMEVNVTAEQGIHISYVRNLEGHQNG